MTVIQEATHSASFPATDLWVGPNTTAGLSVFAAAPYVVTPAPVSESAFWSIAPFRVIGPTSFNMLAVWTKRPPGYTRSLHEALNAYSSFLAEAPSVVIGDFNDNAFWDKAKDAVVEPDVLPDEEQVEAVSYRLLLCAEGVAGNAGRGGWARAVGGVE